MFEDVKKISIIGGSGTGKTVLSDYPYTILMEFIILKIGK